MSKRNIENILSVYRQATEQELRSGLEWYTVAHNACVDLRSDIRVSTGIVAALSPGLRWALNIEAAKRVIAGADLDGLGVRYTLNIGKAYRILAGESPEIVLYAAARSGYKVQNFWRCLLNPKDWFSTCIDGHAYSVWKGKRIPIKDTPNLARKGLYQRIANDYAIAADAVGLLPMQIQAVTWVAYRRIHGLDWDTK